MEEIDDVMEERGSQFAVVRPGGPRRSVVGACRTRIEKRGLAAIVDTER
jgi:nucleoside diphosphate kinase